MNTGKMYLLLFVGLAMTLLVGCGGPGTIELCSDCPAPVAEPNGMTVTVGNLAELGDRAGGAWDRSPGPRKIGNGTFAVFGFPVKEYNGDTALDEACQKGLENALRNAGYKVVRAGRNPDSPQPVLTGRVRQFWVWDYMWFWPVVIGGFENKMELTLTGPNGQVLWDRDFSCGESLPRFIWYSHSDQVRKNMAKMWRKASEAVAEQDFQVALRGGGG